MHTPDQDQDKDQRYKTVSIPLETYSELQLQARMADRTISGQIRFLLRSHQGLGADGGESDDAR